MNVKEPYRATKLWNEVIAAFQSGMPLKKHRRRMQSYDNCFTASDAVTWLHCYLLNNVNFGPNVTRLQTINLLQKFLKCHVIETAIISSKKREFLDDSHLFKFNHSAFNQSKPSALCLIQSPIQVKSRRDSLVEAPKTLQKENLLECHLVEKRLSAHEMKEIFEKVMLSKLESLLPQVSWSELLKTNCIDGLLIKHNLTRLSKTGVVILTDKTDDIPHWVISAMKCLANWPNASGSGSCLPNYPGFEADVFKVVQEFFLNPRVPLLPESLTSVLLQVFCHFIPKKVYDGVSATSPSNHSLKISPGVMTSTPLNNDTIHKRQEESLLGTQDQSEELNEGKLILDDPTVMWDYPSDIYFETDFGTSKPITRVITSQCNSMGSVESVSTISVCSQRSLASDRLPLKEWSSNFCLQEEVTDVSHWLKSFSLGDCAAFSESEKDLSQKAYVCEINDLNISDLSSKTITESGGLLYGSSSIEDVSASQLKCNISFAEKYGKQFVEEYIYSDDLKSVFQLILLLLPSANRRQLHLLLRLINKILKNGTFGVDYGNRNMREYLLKTFLPAIVQSEDVPALCLYQVTAFLLDYCESLFAPPPGLKKEASEVCKQSSGRIKFAEDDLTYCALLSKQQYEEQKRTSSAAALRHLLNDIVSDRGMTEIERRRRLKQFRSSHPDIYRLQFPEEGRKPSKTKKSFFHKLVSLRM